MKKSVLHLFLWMILLAILVGCATVDLPSTVTTVTTDPSTTAMPTQPTPASTTTLPTLPTTAPSTAPTTQPTQPPTEPTQPAFPEELENNVYLGWMDSGFCERMTGKMMITVVFLSDSVSAWSDAEVAAMKATLDADLPKLSEEAASYGTRLEVEVNYLVSKIGISYNQNDPNMLWARSALMAHGLAQAYTNAVFLENHYGVDSAPVVFILNREGRAYAATASGGDQFEYVLMYSSEPRAIRHELCHVYGAIDFYLPDETQEAAEEFLPESIMLDSRTGVVDELTAYLIGWTDVLGPKAEAFLRATNHITEEYLMDSVQGDQMTGYGTKRFDDCTYTGDMVRGVPHGEGTCVWDNGVEYTGGWDNGQMSGYGEISRPDGYSYKGQWKDGQYDGTGTLVYPGGKETYTGEFSKGQRHGQGTHVFSNGDTYTGDWVNGIWSGQGKYTWKTGEVYEGGWLNALRHGQGTMTWTDGSYYTGDWVNGKRTGNGVLYYGSTSERYEGEFKNDKRHGSGTVYKADGTVIKGTWENDKLVQEEPGEPNDEATP
ncbi:MAG: hypothetical protein E7438_04390 [Ruminococcaceae bacterium]|nr:hypothetical protein [Oscillospiraceae bacterium]